MPPLSGSRMLASCTSAVARASSTTTTASTHLPWASMRASCRCPSASRWRVRRNARPLPAPSSRS
eukprot:3397416-Prymnesium_polylepis.1